MENFQIMHIRKYLDNLIKVTDCSVELLSILEGKQILSISDVETLNVRKQNEGKLSQAKLLYDILVTRIGSYRMLIEALLKTKQTGAVRILLEEILLRRKISFQGSHVTIPEVLSLANINMSSWELCDKMVDPSTLLVLTNNEADFVLAPNTIPDTLPYYIDRTLSYRSKLSVEIFKEAATDIFVFEGISRIQLTELAFPNNTDTSGSQLDQDKITVRFILLDLAQDFQTLCKLSKEPIHHIKMHEDNFYWKKSQGSMSLIQQHIHKYQHEVSEVELIESLSNETKAFCISDTPGMGKTLLLANIARTLKRAKPNTISFLFPFCEFVQQLYSNSKGLSATSLIRNISTLGSQTSIGRYVLQRIIENKSAIFDLFLDGYDEILPEHFQLVKQILSTITNEFSNCRVFITTRPHLRSELENQLQTLSVNISPFRESHQIDFIVKYWQQFIDKEADQDNVTHFGRFCLQSLQSCLNDTERVMAGIPLQCMLLADICLPKLLRYLETNEILPSVTSSLFSMYEQLMDIRFKKADDEQVRQKRGSHKAKLFYNSMVGKRQWKRRVIDYHILAAIRVLFPESSSDFEPLLLGKSFFDSNIHINVIGLLEEKCFNDLTPRFVHRTFAEYLFAQFVVEMIRKSSFYKPFLNIVANLLDIVIKSVLVPIPYTEMPLTNPHFKLLSNILLAEVRNPVIAYFIDCHLRKVPLDDINTELIPNFFKVRHHKADVYIHEVLSSCLSKNQSALADYLLHLYIPPAMCADNLIKVATKYSDAPLLLNLTTTLSQHYKFEEIFPHNKDNILSLEIAAQRGNYSIFEILHKLHKTKPIYQQRLLHFCVAYSFRESMKVLDDKKQIIDMILGTDKGLLEMNISPENTTPLLQPNIHYDLFRHLVHNGANVNAVTTLGETCLHKLLHVVEAKVRLKSSTFYNALNLMKERRFEGFRQQNTSTKTCLRLAIENMDLNEDIINVFKSEGNLLNTLDENRENILFYSIRHHQGDTNFKLLVKFGFKITAKNKFKQNLLHVCAEIGNYVGLQYILGNVNDCTCLVNEPDINGNTPLHISMVNKTLQHRQIRHTLLFYGANPNAINDKGNIPLLEGLQMGNGLTVSVACIKIMERFGLNICKEIASKGILNLMCNVNLTSLDINDSFKRVFDYFVNCGGEFSTDEIVNKHVIKKLYSFIESHITKMRLLDKTKLTKELGLESGNLKEIKHMKLEKICGALLSVSNSHSFIIIRKIFQDLCSHSTKFVSVPYRVMHFLRRSSETLLVVKTLSFSIFIARIHDTINPNIPCVDADNLNHILGWSSKVVIVKGYNKNIIDNFREGRNFKLICLPKPHEYEMITRMNVLEDKLLWHHLSFHFQQDIVNNRSNLTLSNSRTCESSLALAIIQNKVPQQLLLSNFIYKQIPKAKISISTLACEKLICIAIRTLFPILKEHVLNFEAQLEFVDLSYFVENCVLLKITHGLTHDYLFATESTAAYFIALAINDEVPNTVKICNEVLEAILRMPNAQVIPTLKGNIQSNKYYYKHVILFLNYMNSSSLNVNHEKRSYFRNATGNDAIAPILKILLFTHVLPCFSYIKNPDFVDKFVEISKGPLLSPKGDSLTETTILLKSVKYASFFTINHMMNMNDDLFNDLRLSEIREIFLSVVTDTHTENLFLVSSRINFINQFMTKCRKISSSKNLVSSSLLGNNVHWQLIKHLIKIGSDPYIVDINKQTIAHTCTTYLSPKDYHNLVEFLICSNYTAVLNHECSNGETPVEAMMRNLELMPETVKLLIENKLISKKLFSESRYNLMHYAIKGGQSREVLEIIYNFALHKRLYEHAVFDAIEFENIAALQYFVELNADINVKTSSGCSPLHYCVKFCHSTLFPMMDMLIKSGADVNKKDTNGHTPLWYAWYDNRQGSPNQHIIEYLGKIGATYS